VSQDREVTTPLSPSPFKSELNDAVGIILFEARGVDHPRGLRARHKYRNTGRQRCLRTLTLFCVAQVADVVIEASMRVLFSR
jgi:hypothetical protein